MSAKNLEDIETGEEIKNSSYVALRCPEGDEVFLNQDTFKQRAVKRLINCKKALNFKKDLGIRVYSVHLRDKEKNKERLTGYLTEKKIRENFPASYEFFSKINPQEIKMDYFERLDIKMHNLKSLIYLYLNKIKTMKNYSIV